MNRDIRFYDFEFNLLHIEPSFKSVNWTVYYNRVGNFEAHFDLKSELTKVLFENTYVVAVQGSFAAVVTGKRITNELAVYGRTLNWLIGKRVTPKFGHTTGTAETLTRSFFNDAFYDIAEKERGIFFSCESDFTKEFTFWRNTFHPTIDVICDCLEREDGGNELVFLPLEKCWKFRIYKGRELNLVISEDNKNAFDLKYNGDILSLYSDGLYEWVNDETDLTEVGRIVRDAEKEGIYRWECCLDATSEDSAISEVSKKIEKKTVTAKCNLEYLTDYKIGDIVSVQINRGSLKTTIKKRIKGVKYQCEAGVFEFQPVFEDAEDIA